MSDGDDHRCPTCDDPFDSEHAVKIHHAKAHDESIAEEIEKTCPECDKSFTVGAQSRDQIHCSEECRFEADRDRVTVECETCGDTVEVPRSEQDRKFCSRDCRREKFTTMLTCENCGDESRVYQSDADRRFCSRECQVEFHRVELECNHCGDVFTRRQSKSDQQFCSRECRDAALTDDSTGEVECAECGETFEALSSRTYCSQECSISAQRDRVSLWCDYCDDEYEVVRSEAERSRYCSGECRIRGQRNWTRYQCTHCEAVFKAPEYEDREFCSTSCHREYLTEQADPPSLRTCKGCGLRFRPDSSHREQQFCTPGCWYESQRSMATRPDTVDELLEELYVERDLNLKQTHKRVKTATREGYGRESMTRDEVRERLNELELWSHSKKPYYRAAMKADPDDLTSDEQDQGDDSWRQFYSTSTEGSADD